MAEDMPIWANWVGLLPARPYCTNNFTNDGVKTRDRTTALEYAYIEYNTERRLICLIFDIDRPNGATSWEDAGLPAPNLAVQNPANLHVHLYFFLRTPVGLGGMSREAPIRLAADVQRGYTRRLNADRSYANRFAKNPLCSQWRAQWLAPQPADLLTLLEPLSRSDLAQAPARDTTGVGRNVAIFDEVRRIAYREMSQFRKTGFADTIWEQRILALALECNLQFNPPLPLSECRSIARSISKWTLKNHTPSKEFSLLQAERGRKGAEVRWAGHQSVEQEEPWREAGISRATYYRHRAVKRIS